jgi:hypothetical protein
MSAKLRHPSSQSDDQTFVTGMDQKDIELKIVENLPPSILNRASPVIVPVQVEVVLQFFVDSIKADIMPVLSSIHTPPGTETVFVKMSTFVPHFLASPSKLSDLILPINYVIWHTNSY